MLFTLGWHYLSVFLRTVASCSFLDSFFPLLVRWCKIAKVIYLHWSFSFPRTSLSAVVDYLSSVSIRASICSQNSSWHADFIVLAFVNQDFLIKNYLVFCSYVIYFKVLSVCLRAEVLIHTSTVVQSHANERVNDGDPFQKRLTMWLALRMFSWKKKSTLCYLKNLRVFVIISSLINNPCNYLLSLNGGLGKGWGFLKIHLILKCTLHHVMLIVLACSSGFK